MSLHARLSLILALVATVSVGLAGASPAGAARLDSEGAPIVAVPAAPVTLLANLSATSASPVELALGSPEAEVLPAPLDRLREDPDTIIAWDAEVAAARPAQEDDPFAVIDECAATEMEGRGIVGASIAIAVDGVITYTKAYGVKHAEEGGEIDAETMFRIGSTSKMMTAASIMALADEGKVDVNAPITAIDPALGLPAPWQAEDITPHHLLTHTSGHPDSYRIYDIPEFYGLTLDEWVAERFPRTPMHAPPGSFWNYANPNFSLAGHLVEVVSGLDYNTFAEQRLWRPLSMTLTTYDTAAVTAGGNFAYGHDGALRLTPAEAWMDAVAPAGGVFSTPSEMVTWALALQNGGGAALSEASATAMQEPQVWMGYAPWDHYGYGVFVTDYRDVEDAEQIVTVYDHGGNTQGWGSQLFWVPERGLTFSILDNQIASMTYTARCVLRELGGLEGIPIGGTGVPSEQWDAYVGTYAEMNNGLWDYTMQITPDEQEGYLLMTRPNLGEVLPLINVFGTTFMIDQDRDGQPDPATGALDFTFLPDRDDSEQTRWVRNRGIVGERIGQFPSLVAIEGDGCATVDYLAERDAPLTVRSAGLVPPSMETLTGQPIVQDDPTDPNTASWRQEMELSDEIGTLMLVLVPEGGEAIDLYLLHDANGDGDFDLAEELVERGIQSGSGARILSITGRPPGGAYQIVAHGLAVGEDGGSFTLQKIIVHGEQLAVEQAPQALVSGEAGAVELCARDVGALDEPMYGQLEFDYGSPPRRVRLPVTWTPAPVFDAFLPLGLRDGTVR